MLRVRRIARGTVPAFPYRHPPTSEIYDFDFDFFGFV